MANFRTLPSGPVTQDDLHAHADGRLPENRIAEVEAYLRTHPADAQRIADWRLVNAALRSRAGLIGGEPLPAEMIARLDRRVGLHWRGIAASLIWLGLGLGLGGLGPELLSKSDAAVLLAREASGAYAVFAPEALHPVELGADHARHLSDWFGKRLGRAMPIPNLIDLGYDLVGGRLMVVEGAPAAMLMYQDESGQRLVLYVTEGARPEDNAPMTYARQDDTGVITWIRDGAGYGLAGNLVETELMPVARSIRAQFQA